MDEERTRIFNELERLLVVSGTLGADLAAAASPDETTAISTRLHNHSALLDSALAELQSLELAALKEKIAASSTAKGTGAKLLKTAAREAAELLETAEEEGADLLEEAKQEANDLLDQARSDGRDLLDDAIREATDTIETAESEAEDLRDEKAERKESRSW